MKKIVYIILTGLIVTFPSCKSLDSVYEEYITPNGFIYPAKATNVEAHPGKNRVEIKWQNGSDPKVVKARIFWNNYTDSIEVAIQPGTKIVGQIIEPLDEDIYSFFVRTYDAEGNVSIPVEVIGFAYGETYRNSLTNRYILSITAGSKGNTLGWSQFDSSNGALYGELWYTNTENKETLMEIPLTEYETLITDRQSGANLKYRMVYVPEMSIDTFYTDYRVFEIPEKLLLDKSEWKLDQFSDQVNTAAANIAENAIDGNINNRWHSANTPYPHWIIIDLGGEITLSHFGLWQSIADVPAGDQRLCSQFELYTRLDAPKNPDDNTGWTKIETFDCSIDIREQVFAIAHPVKGRYLKFVGTKGGTDPNYMVLAEVDAYVQ